MAMNDGTPQLGKIFIGGLSYETTDEKLRAYFSAFGPVTDAVVMKDSISRRSRGFGFITYADPSCVERALAQPNHVLDNRRVEAKRAVPRTESARDSMSSTSSQRGGNGLSGANPNSAVASAKKVFVGGLHYETKDAEFRRYFMQFGKVVSAEVMFNRETNKSRGFGFVIFEDEETVKRVLQERDHIIDGKAVEVKRAVPRSDIQPPRSTSSRANSITGPAGPGSVGSIDDVVSVCSTTSLSRSTTPCSSLSASGISVADSSRHLPSGLSSTNYAAAVRFGIPRSSAMAASLDNEYTHGDNAEKTLARVADALTSLVLEDEGSAHPHSSSSQESVPQLSPLGVPLSDPANDQWNLSPVLAPQVNREIPAAPKSLPHWQSRSWDQGWQKPQRHHHSMHVSEAPTSTPSYFSAFSDDRRHSSSGSGLHHSTWASSSSSAIATPPSSTRSEFGLTLEDDVDADFSFLGNPDIGSGPFSTSAVDARRRTYHGLGEFLQPEFPRLAVPESELQMDASMFDDRTGSVGKLRNGHGLPQPPLHH